MADRPEDRLDSIAPEADVPDPKVYLVVSGDRFVRPALETFYVRTNTSKRGEGGGACPCDTVAVSYCSCDRVCTCNPLCGCQGYVPPEVCGCEAFVACSCEQYVPCTCMGVGARRLCTCDAEPMPSCGCVGYVRTLPPRSGFGGGFTVSSGGCSCNKVCTCVPVH